MNPYKATSFEVVSTVRTTGETILSGGAMLESDGYSNAWFEITFDGGADAWVEIENLSIAEPVWSGTIPTDRLTTDSDKALTEWAATALSGWLV